MPHALILDPSLRYFKGDKSLKWEERQVQLADVDTVEDFWQIYNYIEPASKIGIGSDYALFKVDSFMNL